jgi:putative adenylate-forming enzyme
VLAEIAQAPGADLHPSQIISVAEVLDPKDSDLIQARFQVRPTEIYQATEGFLGATCQAGRIHLNEENLFIEYEWIDPEKTRFHPIITDFSRTTQFFVRHRIDDILRIGEGPCRCGRQSQTVEHIEGRSDEVLRFGKPVFPDTIRQALYGIASPLGNYRVEQLGAELHIRLKTPLPRQQEEITHALSQMFQKLGIAPPGILFCEWQEQALGEKKRRIHCLKPL